MIVMYIAWALVKNISATSSVDDSDQSPDEFTPLMRAHATGHTNKFDIVDIHTVDLYKDEHVEDSDDELDNQEMKANLEGRLGWLWKLYYLIA